MFIAIIDDDEDSPFVAKTMDELKSMVREHAEYNLSEGDTMTIQFFEPSIKQQVSLEYVWTTIGEPKPVKAGKATVEV